jgi:YbbR domain-containing protein
VKFEKTVALEYVVPTDLMFAERPVQEVIFMIEGPRAFVRTVAEREDRLVIDLNKAQTEEGKQRLLNFTVDINPTQLNLPFGMVVERVLPRKIAVRLEKKASKIVPLKPQFMGQLPDKLSLLRSELQPSEVEVYGPRSLIAKLSSVPTKPIDLEGLVGQEEVSVELQLPDERLSVGSGALPRFTYQLKALGSNFEVKDIPIKLLTHSRTAAAQVRTASVKLLVPDKIIKNRSNISASIQVWADVPAEARGRVEVPLKVVLPPGIHLLELSPKSIVVNLR